MSDLQMRNVLTDAPQWEQWDRHFNHQKFYWNIVQFFDDGYGKETLDHITQ